LLVALFVPLAQVTAITWAPDRGTKAMEDRAWKDVQQWAHMNTSRDAVFLVPFDSSGFQLGSYRQVWIDFQQGATVMWSPAFYSRWMDRYPDVRKLTSHADFYNYARAHDLRYYVVPKASTRWPRMSFTVTSCDICDEMLIYSNLYFDVYRLGPPNPAGN
jgi:hypothetical protein